MKRIYTHNELPEYMVASSVEEAIDLYRKWLDKTIGMNSPEFAELVEYYKPFDPEAWYALPGLRRFAVFDEHTGETRRMRAFLFALLEPKGFLASSEY